MIETFRFTGEGLSAAEAFDRYRRLYASGSDVHPGPGPFEAEVAAWRMDRVLLFHRRLSGVVHERVERVRTDEFQHLVITLVVAGALEVGLPGGTARTVHPGQIVLMDARKAMRSSVAAAELITASIARDLAEAALGPALRRIHMKVLDAAEAGMLSDFLHSLVARVGDQPTRAGPALCRALAQVLSAAAGDADVDVGRARQMDLVRREAVDRHIAARLGDRTLSVETIGAAVGVSRSALYRLHERHGGVARYVLRRRLDALRGALDDGAAGSMSELAARFGFANESHMSRAFSAAYGAPPGVYRRLSLSPRGAEDPDLARRRWDGWISVLD